MGTDRSESTQEMTFARILLRILAVLGILPAALWALAALWIDGPESQWQAGLLSAGLLLAYASLILFVRPLRYAVVGVLALVLVVALWWRTLEPRNERPWQADVARQPTATLAGSLLTIHNVRGFRYQSETQYEERWSTQTYNLDELTGFDIFFSFWGPSAYGHTIASWQFGDGRHLAISIETRKEEGEAYSPLKGFFRQYELYYVVAEETDVVALRTHQRGEEVELYRIFTPNQGDRAMLLDYVEDINALAANPRWYNALTQNCTTTMWRHARAVGSSFPLDWRLLANGYVLSLAHELGTVNNSVELDELKIRSSITERARQIKEPAKDSARFSKSIRELLPSRPTRYQPHSGTD